MSARSSGLTVSGTGMLRPGTVRGPGCALAAFCWASTVAKLVSGWRPAICAIVGAASAAARTSEVKAEHSGILMRISPNGDRSLHFQCFGRNCTATAL